MISTTLSHPDRNYRATLHGAFTVAYVLLSCFILKDYLNWKSVNFLIGLGALPMAIQASGQRSTSERFGWLGMLAALLCIVLPVKTLFYTAFVCVLIFCREGSRGKLSPLVFLILLLMSPICQYFASVFSFPIRLWLTNIAGKMLMGSGMNGTVAGNTIICSTGEYAVDPACMGLNMLVTSLLCGMAMLAFYQKKEQKHLSLGWITGLLVFLFGCNIVANLMRILLLVYFRVLPANPMHELTGIICLSMYVLAPASWITGWLVHKQGSVITTTITPPASFRLHYVLLPLLLFAAVLLQKRAIAPPSTTLPAPAGYQVSWYNQEVIKMENATALIYLKPVRGAFYTDHNPLLCWTGSGYGFKEVQEQSWDGMHVFTGILSKGKERLYTAWWYDNGSTRTTDQLTWRWKALRGAPAFTIINVTASNRETLKAEVAKVSRLKLLN